MAGLNFDVRGATASTMLHTLRLRHGELARELAEVERGIHQLEQIVDAEGKSTSAFDRSNFTVAERKIREQLVVTLPWGATAAEIMEATGLSRATVYRILGELKQTGEAIQSEDGHWLLPAPSAPKSQ